MRSKIVGVKNVQRLATAATALTHRAPGMEGLGLVYGETGYGKTKAVTWLINKVNGIYLRAHSDWRRPRSLHDALLDEMEIERPRMTTDRVTRFVIEQLNQRRRPIFIDEADYLVRSDDMMEMVRDIYDMTQLPILLIGEENMSRKLAHLKRVTRRVTQEVRFEPCDWEDAQRLATELCEVQVRDDLLQRLHAASKGAIGLIVNGLSTIEAEALARGIAEIGSEQWGRRDAFFTGEAPDRAVSR